MTAIESSSFVQVLQSLETLNSVMEGVFQRLTERVSEEKNKISSVSSRVSFAKQRIENLQVSNQSKATTVFSPAKFPPIQGFGDAKPIFQQAPVSVVKPCVIVESTPVSVEQEIDFSFERRSVSIEKQQTLQRLPNEIKSVSSLVTFNSRVQPFKNRGESIDPLSAIYRKRQRRIQREVKPEAMAPIPATFFEKEEVHVPKLVMDYTPVRETLPPQAFPNNLSLSGIAEDVNYEAPIDLSILPSLESLEAASSEAAKVIIPEVSLPKVEQENKIEQKEIPKSREVKEIKPKPLEVSRTPIIQVKSSDIPTVFETVVEVPVSSNIPIPPPNPLTINWKPKSQRKSDSKKPEKQVEKKETAKKSFENVPKKPTTVLEEMQMKFANQNQSNAEGPRVDLKKGDEGASAPESRPKNEEGTLSAAIRKKMEERRKLIEEHEELFLEDEKEKSELLAHEEWKD